MSLFLYTNTRGPVHTDKIATIRANLSEAVADSEFSHSNDFHLPPDCWMTTLKPATEEEILKIIGYTASKTCELDPIPTWLLKKCIDSLIPVITKIVNLSFETSTMPSNLKEAILAPLLKKMTLDGEIFKNFRPISNLAYISKLIERIVAVRLLDHLTSNELNEIFQSAYKKFCSTETATLKVQNDILMAIDKQQCVILILLDLSAAFDTVDHDQLLSCMSARLGITDDAIKWFRSYLTDRTQCVNFNGNRSSKHILKYGVPQGSVLGPILFVIYILPIGDILRKYGVHFHIYADDTQIYMSFESSQQNGLENTVLILQQCVAEIRAWMGRKFLKFNDDKTEVIIFGS